MTSSPGTEASPCPTDTSLCRCVPGGGSPFQYLCLQHPWPPHNEGDVTSYGGETESGHSATQAEQGFDPGA